MGISLDKRDNMMCTSSIYMLEKKTISVRAVTVHIYTVVIVILAVLLAFVGLKYLHLRFAVHTFTEGAMLLNSNQAPTGSIAEYGEIIGTTVANYPQGNTLLTQPAALQTYVTTLSKELGRDIVVVDKSRKILADTVAANIGGNYAFDMLHEIDQTVKDGSLRSFLEKSSDYPQGISETVVPMKDTTNMVIGVVIISNTILSK